MARLLRFITNRITIVGILILIQLFVFGFLVLSASRYAQPIFYSFTILSYIVVFFVLVSQDSLNYKLGWIVPILIAPIFGGLFYILFKHHKLSGRTSRQFAIHNEKRINRLAPYMNAEKVSDPQIQKQISHLNLDGWPAFKKTKVTFIPSGADKLIKLKEILNQAKSYIMIEYFIINMGEVWQQIYDILKQKVKAGVKVMLIYDDFGSSLKLPNDFDKKLTDAGIDVIQFNPMKPRINLSMNYRDHRKIVVVDGKYAITGGMNLADEYMNLKTRFGHWQDASIMLEGLAVKSLVETFIQTYTYYRGHVDLSLFENTHESDDDGVVIPFSDSPMDVNLLTKHAYMQLIHSAKKRIIITTPYFIIDQELQTELLIAAASGVQIDIIVPGIPDKKYVAIVSEHYYKILLASPNVYIHKYNKGFIHSKIMYIDDEISTVGTCNFDFRSLYLHFENTVWIYQSTALNDIKTYLYDSMKVSTLISLSDLRKRHIFYRFYQAILVTFSHLL